MRTVTVIYRNEGDTWWAASPDLPGWTAAGDTYEELRVMVAEGAEFELGEPVGVALVAGDMGRTTITGGDKIAIELVSATPASPLLDWHHGGEALPTHGALIRTLA